MRGYIDLVDRLASKSGTDTAKDTDTGFGNDAAIKGFDMGPSHGASSSLQRFDITHWASINDSKSVRFCLESQKISPNYRDEAGLTALMRAADRNATDVIRLLVAAGADMNATDDDGQTALHYAALCDHEEAAGLLVSCGANPDFPDSDNASARDVAGPDALAAICAATKGEWIDVDCLAIGEGRSSYRLEMLSVPTPLLIGAAVTVLLSVALIVRYNIGHS
jgi:ankyrin repeat protein